MEKLSLEPFVAPGLFVLALQFLECRHQRFRDVAAAIGPKPSRRGFPLHCRLHDCSAFRTAATNAFNLAGSLRPGSRSTPETTSTPQGANFLMASPTLSGFNPPATIRRFLNLPSKCRTASQSKVRPLPAPASSNMESIPE